MFPTFYLIWLKTLSINFFDMAKNAVDQLLKMLIKFTENLKTSKLGLTNGQQFVVQQLLNQVLSPGIDMLTAFQPYLNDAKRKEADFDLIPDELIVLVKALLKNAKDGKATPAELILVGMIKDVQAFFNSNTEDTSDEAKDDDKITVNVTQEEVERLLERLLNAMPALKDLDNLDSAGFNHSTIMMIRSQVGKTEKPITGKNLSEALYPYLDEYSWTRMAPALEEIIQDPQSNRFVRSTVPLLG